MDKAVFLDRDGIINYDPGDYTTSLADFTLLPGVPEHLLRLKVAGFRLIVITNQAGIAKGRYTRDTLQAMHDYFQGVCIAHGFRIDAFCFCPHHPDYSRCLCRKPGSLMLEKAISRYRIDAAQSWMIGDKERDMEAARGAGVRGLLVATNKNIGPAIDQILQHE